MKTVKVVAAVIKVKKENGKWMIFATQRGYGEYDYPTFHLSMDCFWAEVVSGNLILREHEAAKWLAMEELDSVDWLPADVMVVEKVRDRL